MTTPARSLSFPLVPRFPGPLVTNASLVRSRATLFLTVLVVLTGFAFRPRLVSLAYYNQGEVGRAKAEVAPSPAQSAMARAAFQHAVAADPDNPLAYLGYGQWLLSQGDPVSATEWLERAVALNPAHPPAHLHLGLAYMQQDRIAEAAAQFRQGDVPPGVLVHWAWQHVVAGRDEGAKLSDRAAAEQYYHAAAVTARDDMTLWRYLAEFYVAWSFWPREYDRALAVWREAASLNPSVPEPHLRAAELVWRQWHDAPAALAELEEAVRIAPGDVAGYFQAADILAQAGDEAGAEAWLRRATEAAPASARAHFRLGELRLEQGRAPEAIQALRTATALAPDEARYQARLAQALRAMGLLGEATQAARTAADLAPDEPAHQRLLGDLYRQAGDRERALAAYRRVLELAPDDEQAQTALQELRKPGLSEESGF